MHLLPAISRLLLVSGPQSQDTDTPSLGHAGRQGDAISKVLSGNIYRRNEEIAAQLAERPIQGVRKMSTDEGEKFFFDYWRFGDDLQGSIFGREVQEGNSTMTDLAQDPRPENPDYSAEGGLADALFLARSYPFKPAFSLESRSWSEWANPLTGRDFKCPTGTNACTSIGRSDRCCGTGDTCEIVPDTGSGDVGCCPAGETCYGGIGSCQSGYTGCSQALGGGCCIPGYDCVRGGCEYYPQSAVDCAVI